MHTVTHSPMPLSCRFAAVNDMIARNCLRHTSLDFALRFSQWRPDVVVTFWVNEVSTVLILLYSPQVQWSYGLSHGNWSAAHLLEMHVL